MQKNYGYTLLLCLTFFISACSTQSTSNHSTTVTDNSLKEIQREASFKVWTPASNRMSLQNVNFTNKMMLTLDYKYDNGTIRLIEAPNQALEKNSTTFVVGGGDHESVNINGQTWAFYQGKSNHPSQLYALVDGTNIFIDSPDLNKDQLIEVSKSLRCMNCK